MVIILGVSLKKNNKFISIRWKFVSTYLLLIIISLIIINLFISQTLLNTYLDERKLEVLTNANIISNRIAESISPYSNITSDEELSYEVMNYSREKNSRIIILNEKGTVKIDSNKELISRKLRHKEARRALNGASTTGIYNFKEFGHVLYVAVPITVEKEIIGVAFLSTSLNDIYNTVGDIKGRFLIISLIIVVAVAIISFIAAGFFSKPIEEFTKAITKMSQGKLGQKVEIDTHDEFQKLGKAFNIMSTKLDQVDNQRKDFVANVSHELKTPLSSIKLLSTSLLHQDENNILIYKEFLKDIDSEIDRLSNIIDDLLDLVDLDKEKLNLNYSITYVNFMLEKIVSRLTPIAEKKSISLDLLMDTKIQIKMDKEKMQQAIINIIHNAIKYTPEDGYVKVKLYTEGEYVVIQIMDNGIGIPQDSLPHIFNRFYRVDKARSRNTGGTGLGLAIANQIVLLHQGLIDVESEVGKGSTFYIKIPQNVDFV